uniref:Cysteine proteinase n=1 Tax=Cannabis sativa TaxID=3483 RepID=A0A803QJB9_CANSA
MAVCGSQVSYCRELHNSNNNNIEEDGIKALSKRHEEWMVRHGKVYKSAQEKEIRFNIFKENVKFIESFNKHEKKYSFKISSCWVFSAVAATEGITKIKKGKLISLSEQQILDCDTNPDDQGCRGGLMENAFNFIAKNGGITSEYAYPYKAEQSTCATTKRLYNVAKIKGYQAVPQNSEAELLKAVAHQPVSVAIEGGGQYFQFYSSGVFTGDCGTTLDHGVTVVGYGTDEEEGTKYWLVKNSWGTNWGEEGYVRIQRDVGQKQGLCGIAMDASYPVV